MNVLVTGSSGRVGSSLVREAVEGGYNVECFDLEDGKDVLDLPQLESAARGCDAIIHLAALMEVNDEQPDELMEVNVGGTANVLAAAESHGIRRIVYMSSAAVLGVSKDTVLPTTFPSTTRIRVIRALRTSAPSRRAKPDADNSQARGWVQ